MKRYPIEDMETWHDWKRRIVAAGFSSWQTQYGWDLPEGYIVCFVNSDDGEKFQIVTHSKEIAEDILNSGL